MSKPSRRAVVSQSTPNATSSGSQSSNVNTASPTAQSASPSPRAGQSMLNSAQITPWSQQQTLSMSCTDPRSHSTSSQLAVPNQQSAIASDRPPSQPGYSTEHFSSTDNNPWSSTQNALLPMPIDHPLSFPTVTPGPRFMSQSHNGTRRKQRSAQGSLLPTSYGLASSESQHGISHAAHYSNYHDHPVASTSSLNNNTGFESGSQSSVAEFYPSGIATSLLRSPPTQILDDGMDYSGTSFMTSEMSEHKLPTITIDEGFNPLPPSYDQNAATPMPYAFDIKPDFTEIHPILARPAGKQANLFLDTKTTTLSSSPIKTPDTLSPSNASLNGRATPETLSGAEDEEMEPDNALSTNIGKRVRTPTKKRTRKAIPREQAKPHETGYREGLRRGHSELGEALKALPDGAKPLTFRGKDGDFEPKKPLIIDAAAQVIRHVPDWYTQLQQMGEKLQQTTAALQQVTGERDQVQARLDEVMNFHKQFAEVSQRWAVHPPP